MKKILVSVIIATMVGASLVACGENKNTENGSKVEQQASNVSVKDVVSSLEEYIPMPMEVDEARAQEMYYINSDNVEEYKIVECGRTPGVGFAMVVKAKEGKVDAVKESMETVLADKVNQAFYPEEKEIAENAKVEVNGNIVSLLIFDNEVREDAMKKFEEAIK